MLFPPASPLCLGRTWVPQEPHWELRGPSLQLPDVSRWPRNLDHQGTKHPPLSSDLWLLLPDTGSCTYNSGHRPDGRGLRARGPGQAKGYLGSMWSLIEGQIPSGGRNDPDGQGLRA